ncbi:MAG: methionyl-tRNA formyltransferase [Firmicutes bacterium]|nr:methionyl-tRNA formyltransferase [Bacillota bacterium]
MKILFMGTDRFAVPTLLKVAEKHEIAAVITQPDKPRGRGKKVSPTAVKEAAEKLGIPVLQPKTLKSASFREELGKYEFDLVLAAAYGKLIPPDFIERPRFGSICLHPSMLPEYRGCSPIESAILDGKTKTGISIFFIASDFDTGDVIFREEHDILPEETGGELRDRLAVLSPDAVIKAIDSIEKGDFERISQTGAEVCYAAKIEKEDALIDWNQTACQIFNRVRAYNPKPGAYTFFRGENVKILKCRPENEGCSEKPGTITDVVKNCGIRVACVNSTLLLTEIQPPGKNPMSAWSFALGKHPEKGEKFENPPEEPVNSGNKEESPAPVL